MEPRVTIVTPTFERDPVTLDRALGSVRAQTLGAWRHIVCSDGVEEPAARAVVERQDDARWLYTVSGTHHGSYGAGVRQEMLLSRVETEYVAFLDDDNILLPAYLEKMVGVLDEAGPDAGFAVCSILHYGPLPFFREERPPILLRGEPKLCHIDTLQVVARSAAMRAVGWREKGYLSDGFTYQALGEQFDYVRVEDCLAVHL